MNEKLEIDDSFEENQKESEKIKDNENEKDNNYNFNNNNILDQPPDEINIVTMKTTKTIKCPDDEYNKNYQNRIQMMTKSIIIRLVKISIILFIFTGIEFLGSYFSNSIGVLTISAVLFTDLIKFTITIISILIIENPANDIMTFGYFRSEIIASLCSMLIVLVLSIWICTNAARKILEPRQLNGNLMIIFSFLGLFFNIIVRYIKGLGPVPDVDEGKFLNNFDKSNEMENDLNTPLLDDYLKLEDKESLKSRALLEKITRMNLTKIQKRELIHLICDMTQILLTLLASILIYYFDTTLHPLMRLWDDICGFTFLIIMLIISYPIAIDCIDILMEAAPKDIDVKDLRNEIEKVNGVINVHDIHFWSLSFGKPCITMHILSNMPQKSLEGATKICKKFGIKHCTIQVEDENEARRLSFMKCDQPIDNNLFY